MKKNLIIFIVCCIATFFCAFSHPAKLTGTYTNSEAGITISFDKKGNSIVTQSGTYTVGNDKKGPYINLTPFASNTPACYRITSTNKKQYHLTLHLCDSSQNKTTTVFTLTYQSGTDGLSQSNPYFHGSYKLSAFKNTTFTFSKTGNYQSHIKEKYSQKGNHLIIGDVTYTYKLNKKNNTLALRTGQVEFVFKYVPQQ